MELFSIRIQRTFQLVSTDMHKKSRLKCGFETAYYPIILFTLKRQGYYQPGFCVRLVFISVSCLGIGHT